MKKEEEGIIINTLLDKLKKQKTVHVIVLFLIVVFALYKCGTGNSSDLTKFDFDTVERGDIVKNVKASGTINPVNVIDVGTQVSGIVKKIFVDYNDEIKEEEILAELDTSILKKNVEKTEAELEKFRANLDFVKLNTERTEELFKKNYIAKVELDQARKELTTAQKEYEIAEAKHEVSKTNLDYAIIKSPVSGIVISRNVDVGQTVAASLQAPVLFQIAEDLENMQIETSISEADIGMIKIGQEVEFIVDSFPERDFRGTIKQIRLNPKTEQNVVTYNVIISINNRDKILLPGMTAYVSIIINERENVLKIRNTTIRFYPQRELLQKIKIKNIPDYNPKKEALLFVVRKRKIVPVVAKKGLSNISYTEIQSDELKEGDKIISDYITTRKNKRR